MRFGVDCYGKDDRRTETTLGWRGKAFATGRVTVLGVSHMPNEDATAVHVADRTGEHLVGIGDLRVILVQEAGCWYAQGLEIDYIAQGESIDQAKANFETGLHATIRENLKIFGTIEPLLTPAPPEVWKERLHPNAEAKRLFDASIHPTSTMEDVQDFLPFKGIEYFQSMTSG